MNDLKDTLFSNGLDDSAHRISAVQLGKLYSPILSYGNIGKIADFGIPAITGLVTHAIPHTTIAGAASVAASSPRLIGTLADHFPVGTTGAVNGLAALTGNAIKAGANPLLGQGLAREHQIVPQGLGENDVIPADAYMRQLQLR